VRLAGIVIEPPGFNDPPCQRQATEHVLVKALLVETPVKALDESVLDRTPGRDIVPSDAASLLPAQDGVRRELSAVVADDHQRLLRATTMASELASHPAAGDRVSTTSVRHSRVKSSNNDEPSKAATLGQHIGDEEKGYSQRHAR
jgi:hypothetical protein